MYVDTWSDNQGPTVMCGPVSNNMCTENLSPNTLVVLTPSLKLVWSHDHTVESMLNVSDNVCSNYLTANNKYVKISGLHRYELFRKRGFIYKEHHSLSLTASDSQEYTVEKVFLFILFHRLKKQQLEH